MATLIARAAPNPAAQQRRRALAVAQQRLMILMLLFVAIIGVIALRLVTFAFSGPAAGVSPTGLYVPPRGDLVDRNGVPLARTIDAYAIRVHPAKLVSDPAATARELTRIFPDTPASAFYAKLTAPRGSYIRRRALPEQVAAVNAIGEIAFDFPREDERLYPQLDMAAHLLGFTSAAGQGVSGVEATLNDRLTDPATRGEAIALSIDTRVQGVLERELGSAVTNMDAIGAAGIILDVHSGEVLAMASLPTFNPNKLEASSLAARRNANTQNVYELGSTFKPLTVAAAIDAGTVTSMARRYDATAPLKVAGFSIRDSHSLGRWVNVPELLMHSSNIGTARVADELGRDRLEAMFRALEFDQRPHVELPGSARTLWPRDWGRVTTMTTSYGHGIAVTPLHLASAYAALVNGGVWRPATILRLGDRAPAKGRRVFKPATSARMRQLLRLIVAEGTGRKAEAPGFRVGGKTGSAEKPLAGGYNRSSVVATFAAAFPMDDPRYVVLVMIDEPKGNAFTSGQRTAGYTAAPVVGSVITRTGPMLGVVPDAGRDVDVADLAPLIWKAKGE